MLAALFAMLLTPGMALAGFSGCRADPVITLTDGTVLQMEATIGTNMGDVQNIEYTVHAPRGSRVLLILYTDSLLGIKERVRFYADSPTDDYTTTTVVNTGRRNVSVSATSRVIELLGIDTGSASGQDRQNLDVRLDP
jgi:hypothetical protein